MVRLLVLVGVLAACGNDTGVAPDGRLPPRLRLLTDSQYTSAVRDLLGDIEIPAIRSPGTRPHQFIHDDNVLAVDAPLLVQYRLAAEAIAQRVSDRSDHLAFAERAFRRPLDPHETAQLEELYARGRFPLVVEAVLQAPSFVYRSELGDGRTLAPYELASALGFLFYDSLPDDALLAAARDGTLAANVGAHVDRLLELPRVRAHLTDVVMAWLGLHRIATMSKEGLSDATRASMAEQTRRFVHDVLWERGGGLRELLASQRTFVDAQLAPFYGVTPTTFHMEARLTDRAGILSHPGVMAMLGSFRHESIIARGVYVHRTFLCTEELGRPPFDAIRASLVETVDFSEQELARYRAEHLYCSGCHVTIDPPGQALHRYDSLGKARDVDGDLVPIEDEVRLPIDGTVVRVRGPAELAHLLADSDQVARCVVNQLAHHALGRGSIDPATRAHLLRSFEMADRDLVEVFRAIAMSPVFVGRAP